MKIRDYQRTWQGVNIDSLTGERTGQPAGAAFYERFYGEAVTRGIADWHGRETWMVQKRSLGSLLADLLQESHVHPHSGRILSVGAGYGIVEEALLERGFIVNLQECQLVSLRQFVARHQGHGAFVCDGRALTVKSESYRAVLMIAVEYAFSDAEYRKLFREVARVIVDDGIAIVVTLSTMQFRDLVLGIPRRLRDRIRHSDKPAVCWGYRRTIDVHSRLAADAGLHLEATLGLDSTSSVLWRRDGEIHTHKPLFTDAAQVALVFRKHR